MRAKLRNAALAVSLALLAYLPWWPTLLGLLQFRAQVGAIEGGVGHPLAFLSRAITAVGPFEGAAWLFVALFGLGLVVIARQQPDLAVLGGAWFSLPLLLPLLLGDSRGLQVRYAFIVPIYLLIISLIVWHLAERFSAGRRVALSLILALGVVSALGLPSLYETGKPAWRQAAEFVAQSAGPNDVIISGPLWDDGRFFGYYFPEPERVLPAPVFVARLPGVAAELLETQGRVWLVGRAPSEGFAWFQPENFYGVIVQVPERPEFDPVRLIAVASDFCRKAARQADDWAVEMAAGGVLTPDPRTATAAGYRCQGDVYWEAGRLDAAYYAQALEPYQRAVAVFPGWAGGYALLAKTHFRMDNLPAALQAYEQAVALNPHWQGETATQAAHLAAEGRLLEAVEAYQQAVE